jgi:hypothetical protein
VVLLDATFYSPAEMPGVDLSVISHPCTQTFFSLCSNGADPLPVPVVSISTVPFFRDLAGKDGRRIILTHLNHSNPLCNPESLEVGQVISSLLLTAVQAKEVIAAGFEIASEMMEIPL